MSRERPDDDRTVIRTGPRTRPGDSAFVGTSAFFGHTLPEGTRLGEFEVIGLVGEGGFGIVYLAYDHSLERRVALKEYMPSSLAARASSSPTVAVKSQRHLETFEAGLKSFVNEARLLAQFDHPALVKVHRFWEDNGTAYMVMPYYEGPTLKARLRELGQPPDEAQLRDWLRPLLDALAVMHKARCYHRDIAPDNILLTEGGPLLLDFGAARQVIGDLSHALTAVLKPGYAPIEQYGEVPGMAQGAWTDIYALGGLVHFAITGKPPMPSVERLISDRLEPLSKVAAGRYSEAFLAAIDAALAVRPDERPQDIAQLRALLGAGSASRAAPAPAMPHSPPTTANATRDGAAATTARTVPMASAASTITRADEPAAGMPAKAAGIALAVLAVGAAVWWFGLRGGTAPSATPASSPTTATATAGSTSPATPQAASAADQTLGPTPTPTPTSTSTSTSTSMSSPLSSSPSATTPAPAFEASPARPTPVKQLPRVTAHEAQPADGPSRQQRAATTDSSAPSPADDTRAAARKEALQRCSDTLQKASLEVLTPEETAFLKRDCK